jgi:hypothetical protein
VATLAEQGQCTRDEALQTLEQLRAAGVVESLVHRGSAYRLRSRARDQLRARLRYGTSRPLDAHWDMIRAYLDTVPEIGRDDVVALLGVTPVQASRILSQLFRDRGVIEPVGNARGRGVRYRVPKAERVQATWTHSRVPLISASAHRGHLPYRSGPECERSLGATRTS